MKKMLFLLLLFPLTRISAQDKILTPESCVFGFAQGFYPEHLNQLGWIKGTDEYYYVDKPNGVETLVSSNAVGKGPVKKIIDINQLNALIKQMNIPNVSDQKNFPAITWKDATSFSFDVTDATLTYSLVTNKLESKSNSALPTTAMNSDVAPNTNYVAYTVVNNLFVHLPKSDGTAEAQITNDKDTNIVNGKSVHREEFGISKGTFWSPSGNLLAFYRMDQTMVTDYPIMDLTKQPAQAHMIKYPMAGGTSHQVTVGVYNVGNGKTVFLKTEGPKDQYLTNIAWSPDDKFVYIAVLNRDQNHLWLNRYNAETGAFDKTLFEEKDPKYVHPMHPLEFVPGHPDEFIWQRELCSTENPDGLNCLLLFNTDGKMLQQLSSTTLNCNACYPVNVTDVYGFDPSGTTLYYQAAHDGSCDKDILASDLKGGDKWSVIHNGGTHAAIFSDDKKYFIDTYSDVDVPCIQSIYDNTKKQVKVLFTAKNPLIAVDPTSASSKLVTVQSCKVKLFTITAADNETKLWCRMILPAGFDSTKKYRTLTYVYNGPNVQLVTNSWLGGADLFLYYMAQQGFIVFTVDGRGSDNRGMKFEQATFQHMVTQQIAEQEKGHQ